MTLQVAFNQAKLSFIDVAHIIYFLFYSSQKLLAMPDAEFELIPMSATDKLRKYYRNTLEKLSLDELRYISRTLGSKGIEPLQ